ncbi:MAG: ABC transporter ATP-binding protein, partial [Burkholderiales bacterium]|nr:ABC transporter ATP-binding protein [Burkholderiales bacterium]
VLDEPTNDLDVETLELLEEMLENYNGTVFLVSHDRVFLDNVVTQSLVFLGDGKILEMVGGYSDWLSYRDRHSQIEPKASNKTIPEVKPPQRNKLSYKDKVELEQLPKLIEQLEKEQGELNNKLLDVELYKTKPQEMVEYQIRIAKIEEGLLIKLERWETLQQK